MNRKDKILELLEEHYKGAKPGLHFRNAYELLIATILSAQCTDERVNIVTKDLFAHYPDPKSLANADFNEVSDEIHSCGFYLPKRINCRRHSLSVTGGNVYRNIYQKNMAIYLTLPSPYDIIYGDRR